eukprot:CAMPEP_0174262176 /NCGR_PEP_ID=MMETSP0439-20130205/12818_1 /TAXON_ID=0 /ORGANISM="Stereomyxa ramosa, Strain Chinc5" /LENGTH=471 /DNA_ID=CAMNT_0015346833 /DNA_START=171 /DNA_END=1586 /DNA_ORIENTATION=-
MNQRVVNTEYAVRGELVIKAVEHQHTLRKPNHSLPFDEILFCNIGNPQSLNQKPITFLRQVCSLMEYPDLLDKEGIEHIFAEDAIARARKLLASVPGGIGAYSGSSGVEAIREDVASFIEERDGHPSDPNDIFLTNGASSAVTYLLNCLIRDSKDGVMIPIPQYPLYSATIPLLGGSALHYYLNEEESWGLDIGELKKVIVNAKNDGITPRALVIINPGNPTGQSLDSENMQQIVEFCAQEKILLIADEVYQANSYTKPFCSFKKIVRDLGDDYKDFELVSLHSASKGFTGECGKRGGYMELCGFDPAVKEQIYKLASLSLCSNVPGQVVIDLMVNPPKKGDPSYEHYHSEWTEIIASLKRRADTLMGALNQMEGVSCNPAEGAMYLFPSIRIPAQACEEAKRRGKKPDTFYCLELLNNTGICVVPGSGFGQKDGTYHFRTTFLPPEDKIEKVAERMSKFHAEFVASWGGL